METRPMTASDHPLSASATRSDVSELPLRSVRGEASEPPAVAGSALDSLDLPAGTQTLLRGLAIIEACARGARDMRAFAAALGTTRSTTHRLVHSLVQARYLRQVPQGYLLGPKLIELGTVALEQMPLTAVARPHLERLAQATLDTVHLGVRDGEDVLYIDKLPGTRGLEMRSRAGHKMPLACTGIGKALMLDLSPQMWSSLYDAAQRTLEGVRFEHSRRPDKPLFLQRMVRYAAGQFSFDLEENEPTICCVAAPVRDATGAIVAAISVASTTHYMSQERMDELIPVVQRTARAISEELGWSAPAARRIKR
ncbi:MAG: IclR family transcriptional regulator [Burkholderiales bacterium]|nr:IclR family transcriptional regulator [Burkholderiales bacterium]TAM54620.1 MAG: IclR family transcriptional regulator [Paraburkholderia sp.]